MDTTKFLAFGCAHAPLTDPEAWGWLIEQVAAHKPDVVACLGDWTDSDAASRWTNEHEWTLTDEFKMVDRQSAELRKVAGRRCKLVWMPGNHEYNLTKPNRIPKKMRDRADYLNPEFGVKEAQYWKHFKYIRNPKYCVFRIGQVSLMHGFDYGEGADKTHAISFAAYCGLNITAHTHRPTPVTQVRATQKLALPFFSANVGTLATLDPPMDYMEAQDHQRWGQAVVIGDATPLKSPREGRYWDAETIVRRHAWDTGAVASGLLRVK